MDNDINSVSRSSQSRLPALAQEYRRSGHRGVSWWLIAGDGVGLVFAWLLSFGMLSMLEVQAWDVGIAEWWAEFGNSRIALIASLFTLALLALGVRGHYTRRRPFADEVLDVTKVFLFIAVLDALLDYLGRFQFSRSWFIVAWLFAIAFVLLARLVVKRILIRINRWQRPTVLVGAGANARETAKALYGEPLMGLEVVAFLSLPGEATTVTGFEFAGRSIPILPLSEDLYSVLDNLGAPQVIVALDAESLIPHEKLLQKLFARYGDMSIIPPLRGLPLYGMEVTHFFSHEVLMLNLRNNLARPGPQFFKRSFDLIGSLLALLLLAPLFAYLSWQIRRSAGPAIFGHERIGRHGTSFRCFKFRTMVADADNVLTELLARDPVAREEWMRSFKLKNDPRITPIGAFLRRTSLDELPQLWNVVKGEMSLVGPRPVMQEELQRYGDQVGYYLEARPGITGLWQISGRNNTGYEDRVSLDCWYVRNWSLWYDFVVLVKTVRVVLRQDGAY